MMNGIMMSFLKHYSYLFIIYNKIITIIKTNLLEYTFILILYIFYIVFFLTGWLMFLCQCGVVLPLYSNYIYLSLYLFTLLYHSNYVYPSLPLHLPLIYLLHLLPLPLHYNAMYLSPPIHSTLSIKQ